MFSLPHVPLGSFLSCRGANGSKRGRPTARKRTVEGALIVLCICMEVPTATKERRRVGDVGSVALAVLEGREPSHT